MVIILGKIFYLLVLIAAGILARRLSLLSEKGEKDLSKLLVDIFWPAAIFASITLNLQAEDIVNNLVLPLSALVTAFTGLILALIIVKIFKFKDIKKQMFLFHSSINNFVFMVIPFAVLFLPEKGLGLLFLHNLGYLLFLWLVGVTLLQGKSSIRDVLKRLLTPGLIATVLGVIFVLTGLNNKIPNYSNSLLFTIVEALGKPTIAVAMIIAGSSIFDLGVKALKFDKWNISLGVLRLLIIPFVLFALTLLLRPYFNDEVLIIFMLVNVMPVSVNSVSIARRFKSSPELAAEGVVFTHLFGIPTMILFIYLIQQYFSL